MKRLLGAFILLAASGMSQCGPTIPTVCEEGSEKEQERCQETFLLTALILAQNKGPSPQTPASPAVNFIDESAYQLNGTFAAAQTLPRPSPAVIQSLSGRINAESDVDIYVMSYTSGQPLSFVIDASKPGTPAVCAMYTRFGESALDSAVPDGSLIPAGTLAAGSTPVVLDRVSRTHLYIRCSGLLNETYTVRFAYSTLNN